MQFTLIKIWIIKILLSCIQLTNKSIFKPKVERQDVLAGVGLLEMLF